MWRPSVIKTWTVILLAAVTFTSSGCFEMPSVYPIYTDQTAVAEPRIVGAWQTKDGKDQMFVRGTGDRSYRITYLDDQGEASLWEFRVVKLGETSVADMSEINDERIPAHHFLAMSFDNGVMKFWFLDSSVLREKAGKEGLGYIRGKKDDVVLTAPTATLVEFLKRNLADEMKRNADQEFVALK